MSLRAYGYGYRMSHSIHSHRPAKRLFSKLPQQITTLFSNLRVIIVLKLSSLENIYSKCLECGVFRDNLLRIASFNLII